MRQSGIASTETAQEKSTLCVGFLKQVTLEHLTESSFQQEYSCNFKYRKKKANEMYLRQRPESLYA